MRRPLVLALAATLLTGCGQAAAPPAPSARAAGPSPTVSNATAAPPTRPSATEATGSTPDGSIVFMRSGADGHFETWTSCVDLTRSIQVPSEPGRDAGWAVWAPDGARIAFNANFDDPDLDDDVEIWDIYTMDPDGGNVVRLTNSPGLYGDPGYSADGTMIAFDSTVPGQEGVYVMRAVDGKRMHRVTGLPDGVTVAYAPRFSPDATELVFTGVFGEGSGALYVVGLDGTGLRRITPATLSPDKAAWSPSSGGIVFDASSDGFPFQSLWTVRPDGTALTNITADTVGKTEATDGFSGPAWSPDGSMILALHGLHLADGTVTIRLATIRPDGTDLRDVSDGNHGDAIKPDWRAAAC